MFTSSKVLKASLAFYRKAPETRSPDLVARLFSDMLDELRLNLKSRPEQYAGLENCVTFTNPSKILQILDVLEDLGIATGPVSDFDSYALEDYLFLEEIRFPDLKAVFDFCILMCKEAGVRCLLEEEQNLFRSAIKQLRQSGVNLPV